VSGDVNTETKLTNVTLFVNAPIHEHVSIGGAKTTANITLNITAVTSTTVHCG